MIQSVAAFIDYFGSIRRRTVYYAKCIPPERIDWQPQQGESSGAEILRHITAAEQMYVRLVVEGHWRYDTEDSQTTMTVETILAQMESSHQQAMERLRSIPDTELMQTRPSLSPEDRPVKVWRWLMAMVEHEVHHRSQIASYLMLMGVEPPQIYGMKLEEVIARAQ